MEGVKQLYDESLYKTTSVVSVALNNLINPLGEENLKIIENNIEKIEQNSNSSKLTIIKKSFYNAQKSILENLLNK